jgi:hypothetical protein
MYFDRRLLVRIGSRSSKPQFQRRAFFPARARTSQRLPREAWSLARAPGADRSRRSRKPRSGHYAQFERLLADEAFQGRDPGLVLLEQVGGLNFVVESASLVLLNPYADQVSADIVALRQAMERLAGEKLLATWRLNSMLYVRCLAMGCTTLSSSPSTHKWVPNQPPVTTLLPALARHAPTLL